MISEFFDGRDLHRWLITSGALYPPKFLVPTRDERLSYVQRGAAQAGLCAHDALFAQSEARVCPDRAGGTGGEAGVVGKVLKRRILANYEVLYLWICAIRSRIRAIRSCVSGKLSTN